MDFEIVYGLAELRQEAARFFDRIAHVPRGFLDLLNRLDRKAGIAREVLHAAVAPTANVSSDCATL